MMGRTCPTSSWASPARTSSRTWRLAWRPVGGSVGSVGTVWGQSGDSLGTIWGQSGDSLGTVWGQSGDSLGTVWGQSGESPGPIRGQCGDSLGQTGDNVGTVWRSRIRLGLFLESYTVGYFGAPFLGTCGFLRLGAGGSARGGQYSQSPPNGIRDSSQRGFPCDGATSNFGCWIAWERHSFCSSPCPAIQ